MSKRERPINFFEEEDDDGFFIADTNQDQEEIIRLDDFRNPQPEQLPQLKQQPPVTTHFEDDDEDYLINASMENDYERDNEVADLDIFVNQKPTTLPEPYPNTSDNVSLASYTYDDMDNDTLFLNPSNSNARRPSITDAMDGMDISDYEMDDPFGLPDISADTTTTTVIAATTRVENLGNSRSATDKYSYKSSILKTRTKTTLKYQKKHDFTKIPETGAFVTAACPKTGQALYYPQCTESEKKSRAKDLLQQITAQSSGSTKRGLLMKPIWQLRRNIEKANKDELEEIQRDIEEANARKKKKKKVQPKDEDRQLWVDKYRPLSYTDLMGDQRLNRDVLRWVKQWDYCVFKKDSSKESQRDKAMRQYKDKFGTNPKFEAYKNSSESKNDPLKRPDKKILLLSGPPGFGKTTMAHVIAKQAGYNVIEVNASDDRTGASVKHKIKAALEMQAIIQSDTAEDGLKMTQRPNLLIIDEIDGVSAAGGSDSFIKQLVHLATVQSPDSKKKGKSQEKPLMRPIICICNDVYAPVLRPLRMIAQSTVFKRVPTISTARRLQEICNYESLDTDLRTLSLLSEMADGDIRSCLNTLQFIRGKSTVFTKNMLDQTGVGKKDMGKSVFSVWDELFSAPNARKKTGLDHTISDEKYFGKLFNSVMSNGEIDRIMQGCFESYPLMRFHDVALQKSCMINEWLHFYDRIDFRANVMHEHDMYRYLPYPVVNFHRFFAGSVSQDHRIEYPRADYEAFTTKKSFENLIAIFLAGIHPSKRRYLNKDIVASELVPLLMHVITPDLKPVNKQLIKPAEKEKLTRLIDIMIEFGLSYVQEKTEDGQFVYKLEPPVEQLLNFELSTPKAILPKQYATRQMIAQEIEHETIRRREELSDRLNSNKMPMKASTEPQISLVEKIQQKIGEKHVPLDFFGRKVIPKPVNSDRPLKNLIMEVDTPHANVMYKFHEGFSNAVRKPMIVKMFL